MEDFEELRRLLLSREQEQLRELRDRVEDKEKRAQDISGVLPQAVKLSRERGGELTRALQPAVEGSIRESIKNQPGAFVEAFHPIIGPIVRRSIAESLRGLLQSLNQTLEHTFSWQGLKWRFEALRTGKSFAEVVLLRSLVYRVEQIFLIHRETSLSLLHVAADAAVSKDSDMVAGMLSAILDFTRDSFQAGEDATLEEFRVGEMQVWIAPGRYAYLAAAIRGNPSRDLHAALDEAIDNAHILKGSALAKFNGDASIFEPLRPELEACLRAQYKQTDAANASHTKAGLALAATAAALTAACVVMLRSEGRWRDFLGRLSAEPGIAVTTAHKGWFSASRVAGLRDPLAADPAPLARQAGVNPARIQFEWKDYLALDSTTVRRRFEQRFGVPAGAQVAVADGVAKIAGSVPYEWIERVRREGAQVPGVNALTERELKVTYDPALVLKRFQAAFPLPPGVTARVEDGTLRLAGKAAYEWIAPVREGGTRLPGVNAISEQELDVAFDPALVLKRFESRFGLPDTVSAAVQNSALTLSGEASHAWLARVRKGATEVPGITSLDESNLIDLDQQTFQQSKSVIESAFVYFLVNKDNFATEGFAALSRLPDEIRRCQTAAKRIGTDISIEIRGSADAVGSEAKNVDLSQRRAHAVRDFLVSCGLDAPMLKPLALGAPSAASREQSRRPKNPTDGLPSASSPSHDPRHMIQKKICMIGTSGVGKTSLVSQFVDSIFSDKYLTTVGVKISKKTVIVDDTSMTLVIWDLAGDDDFQRLNLSYLRGTAGYLLVADGTRRITLEMAVEIQQRVTAAIGPVPFVLALNKADLTAQWEIEDTRITSLTADGWKIIKTSAKAGAGVEEAFSDLGRRMIPPQS